MSLEALLVFALIAGLSFAYGQAFLRLTTLPPVVRSSLNLRFLTGFLCVNSLLFVLSIASPLSVPANAVLVSAIAALLAWWQRGRPAGAALVRP